MYNITAMHDRAPGKSKPGQLTYSSETIDGGGLKYVVLRAVCYAALSHTVTDAALEGTLPTGSWQETQVNKAEFLKNEISQDSNCGRCSLW